MKQLRTVLLGQLYRMQFIMDSIELHICLDLFWFYVQLFLDIWKDLGSF